MASIGHRDYGLARHGHGHLQLLSVSASAIVRSHLECSCDLGRLWHLFFQVDGDVADALRLFVGTFLVFSTLRNRRRILKAVVLTSLVLGTGILFGVDDLYRMTLSSGLDTAGSKTAEKVLRGHSG